MIKRAGRILAGLIFVFFILIPKIILNKLEHVYFSVFNKESNLTANPKVHLNRAKKLLKRKRNSLLLYAALEIRFAVERILDHQLSLSSKASKNMLKEYDPVKKKKSMSLIDKNSDFDNEVYLLDKKNNTKIKWGNYKTIDQTKLTEMKGKLGDLLHPKIGLPLGLSNHKWYKDTRNFLLGYIDYLEDKTKNNESYFLYEDMDNFEFVKKNKT